MGTTVEESKKVRVGNLKEKFTRFFKEIYGELKKVIWPTREQLINNTVTVLIACILAGLIIWVVDLGLTEIHGRVFEK